MEVIIKKEEKLSSFQNINIGDMLVDLSKSVVFVKVNPSFAVVVHADKDSAVVKGERIKFLPDNTVIPVQEMIITVLS